MKTKGPSVPEARGLSVRDNATAKTVKKKENEK